MTPLHQLADAVQAGKAALLKPRDTVRQWIPWSIGIFGSPGGQKNYMMALGNDVTYYQGKTEEGQPEYKVIDGGENPPDGVLLAYTLAEELGEDEEISLTILDDSGNEIKTFSSKKDEGQKPPQPTLPALVGLNRFVWNMRFPGGTKLEGDESGLSGGIGPKAAPGSYQAQLKVGGDTISQSFSIVQDPRVAATQADFEAQFKLSIQIRDKLSAVNEGVNRLRRVRRQVQGLTEQLDQAETLGGKVDSEAITEAADALLEKLETIENELVQTKGTSFFDRLRLPSKLDAKLLTLTAIPASADFAPPQQAYDVFAHLSGLVDAQLVALKAVMDADVPAFSKLVKEADIPAVIV